jgi:hypothetical protein
VSKVLRRRWQANLDAGLSRRDRQGCDYEAYVPDLLTGRRFRLDGDVAEVADAERTITEMNATARTLVDTEALARLLLRAESVASSYIEGLVVCGSRLLRAEAALAAGEAGLDVTAEEVLRNIQAMTWAVEALASAESITLDGVLTVHERLLSQTRLSEHAGRLRDVQNWIGGSSFTRAPLPSSHRRRTTSGACSRTSAPSPTTTACLPWPRLPSPTPSSRPFTPSSTANGRRGRALIHVVLRRRGLAPRILAPVSLVLATGRGPTSKASPPPVTADVRSRRRRTKASTVGLRCSRPPVVVRSTTPRRS